MGIGPRDVWRERAAIWRGRLAAAFVALAGYALLAAATIRLTTDGRTHATVWLADALVLALALCRPRRDWPALLVAGWLGNLAANTFARGWMPGLVAYGAINMAEVFVAAHLLHQRTARGRLLDRPRDAGRFLLVAGLCAPACGALAGSLVSLWLYQQPFWPAALRWLTSNGLGLVIGTPFFLALFDGNFRRWYRERTPWDRVEGAALMMVHLALVGWVFSQSTLPVLFLPLVSLLVLTFRIGSNGTIAGVTVIAVAGAFAALAGTGPIALMHHGPVFAAFFFQLYLAVVQGTTLPVAVTVTSLHEAITRVDEREQALRQLLAHSPDSVLSFDQTGICRWADGQVLAHLGLAREALVGRSIEAIARQTSPVLAEAFRDIGMGLPHAPGHMAAIYPATYHAPRELVPARHPGKTLEASFGTLSQQGGMVVTLRDISARKLRESLTAREAETDDLTGVFNRKGFRERATTSLSRAARDGRPMTVALIDVDHFKSVNDRFGHRVGDGVLAAIGAHLAGGIRATDIVGRLGGDEFAILFEADLETARQACERIATGLRTTPIPARDTISVSVSISCGVAEYVPGMTRGQLFDAADAALYAVKAAGRNGVRTAQATDGLYRMAEGQG